MLYVTSIEFELQAQDAAQEPLERRHETCNRFLFIALFMATELMHSWLYGLFD